VSVVDDAQLATVAIMFTDLVASTHLSSRAGPDRAEELRLEHFRLLRDAIAEANGREVKNLGDGLMVAFSSAAAALECAALMQRRIEVRNRRADYQLAVRIGVSMGDAVHDAGDYFGDPVVEAARLCAKAEGGQILLTDSTRTMAGRRGNHAFIALGDVELKGLPAPVAAWELVWEPTAAPTFPLPTAMQVLPETGYVGREELRARLSALWEAASGGERRVVLLAGEPGIGKTRLATNLALAAQSGGAAVLYGRCEEELAAAYKPWAESFRHYVENAPANLLSAYVRAEGGELSRLVPGLASRLPDVPPPRTSDPETERYMLFGSVVALLEHAARDAPVLLVLDDLHWADKPSLSLLRHVVGEIRSAPLMVIVIFRDSDIGADHPLTALLADLAREQGVERVDLAGLTAREVASLMEAAAGHELDAKGAALAAEVSRETDGNPFFVAEILRHLLESGAIVQRRDGRYEVAERLGDLGLPHSIKAVVGQRVQRLGDAAVLALGAAAVIGREFDLELLARVTERAEDELLELLEMAVAGSVLQESTGRPGRFSFAHALINHTLYDQLGQTRRARLHRRVAEAIEELYGVDADARLAELAYHWAAATETVNRRKSVHYARRAGERALEQLAPDEALRWFDQALDHLDSIPGGDELERCELLIGRGEAQRQTGRPEHREVLLDAAAMARRLKDPDRLARAVLANTHGWVSSVGTIDRQRVEMLEAAMSMLPGGDVRRARLLALLAAELSYSGDFPRRQALCGEALATARAHDDPRTLVTVIRFAWQGLWTAETLDERRMLAKELARLADLLQDPLERLYSRAWSALAALESGDGDALHVNFDQLDALAAELGQPLFRWVSLFLNSTRAQLLGDVQRAEALAIEALKLGSDIGEPDALTFFAMQLMAARWEQGRLHEIVELLAQRARDSPGLTSVTAALGFVYAELGRDADARRLLEDAAGGRFRDVPKDITWLITLARYADIAARLDVQEHANELYDILLPFRHHLVTSGVVVFGSAERILGLLASTLGRHALADEHFAAAVEVHQRLDASLFLARTWMNWGQAQLRQGPERLDAARDMLGRAIAIAAPQGDALATEATALVERATAR
jgi:class 3 adenylate cyclase/tetratricopeptide (TPR) repeat protein